ncbi:MAG: protein phosphatase CheZ [Desulfatibacillum sp.]|nr:protein phosphatase CheZ [Desulfatibacillum sp.]
MQLDNETLQDIVMAVKELRHTFECASPAHEDIDRSRGQIGELLTTLEMLMAEELMEICDNLAVFLENKIGKSPAPDNLAIMACALETFTDHLDKALTGDHGDYGMAEVLAILSGEAPVTVAPPPPAPEAAAPPAEVVEEEPGDGLPDVSDMLETSLAPAEPTAPSSAAGDFQVSSPVATDNAPAAAPPALDIWKMDTEEFFKAFKEHLKKEGGEIHVDAQEDGEEMITLSIPRSKIGGIQAAFTGTLASGLSQVPSPDAGKESSQIVNSMLEFMKALTAGDIDNAEKIIEGVTKGTPDFGLFGEIGQMARALHNSLREFSQTLDPEMKGLVEDKLPDSSLRLEHIIELTENAASTTMDLTEVIQERNEKDMALMEKLKESSGDVEILMASMDTMMDLALQEQEQPAAGSLSLMQGLLRMARKQVLACGVTTSSILESTALTNKDLVDIFTAQDYQDLTGQVIQKVIVLIQDLEKKLLNLVLKFGVKISKEDSKQDTEELYGPSHSQRDDAVHSQDEVDALLKEFGF